MFVIFVIKMMNTAYFDHNSSAAAGFYNSVQAEQAHQAYRFASQSALSSLMPTSTYPTANLRSGQTAVQADGTTYDSCKLYDGTSAQPFKTEAFKDCGITKDQNGFKPDHQMPATNWANSLRPSPSATSMSTDMRNFDATVAACSRSVTDPWSAAGCCNSSTMSSAGVGGAPNSFYPWMAIAGTYLLHPLIRYLL